MSPAEHALCGALAGTLAACTAPGPLRGRGPWVFWTTAGALAPDLDAVSLLFSHAIYFGDAWYSHRQFLHSILGCAFLAVLLPSLASFARRTGSLARLAPHRGLKSARAPTARETSGKVAARAVFAGGLLHLLGDLPTPPGPWGGLPIFFPLGMRAGGWSRIGWINAALVYLLSAAALAAGALLAARVRAPSRWRPRLRAGAGGVAALALAGAVGFAAASRYESFAQWRAWQARFVPAAWIDALHHSGRWAAVFWEREVLRAP
jgi:membrane-bound metal-dependent hydrolase YbcI (DUF457 family)